jgi:hypothetical protein
MRMSSIKSWVFDGRLAESTNGSRNRESISYVRKLNKEHTHPDKVQYKSSSTSHLRCAVSDVVEDTSCVSATNDEDPELEASVPIQVSWARELELRCCASNELQQRRGQEEGEDEELVA